MTISAEELKQEVKVLAQEIGVNAREIHIRKMKRKWASCSNKGRLTFSTSLLSKPDDFRRKAMVHELLHMRYPNHGKMFNLLLASYSKKK
ncbi:M48 family metallopeptidase [Dehalococcoidia bacterium]|nr:M48 family metallopeptidase [Dehalococcoidia bacterium]MCL0070523.1 M48 family metallopeptidase [Dehalococcoidia bacterium]